MTAKAKTSTGHARCGMSRPWYIALNVFIVFHLIAIACWALPIPVKPVMLVRLLTRPYIVWSGLFQSWDMFSPSPKQINTNLEALIIYKDQSTETWPFPRMEDLSYGDRYRKERFRKLEENLEDPHNALLWPDIARHIARDHNHPANPPEVVILVLRWSRIVPHDSAEAYDRTPSNMKAFFTYQVRPEDLE